MSTSSQASDEAQIRALLDQWARDLAAKNLDGLVAHYAPDIVFFDAVPPFQSKGIAAYRQSWEHMLPHLPPDLATETRDEKLAISGDVAFAHCLTRMIDAKTRESATCGWVRVTVCFQRRQGEWRVVHEHVSVPFDPMMSKPVFLHQL
jgi:uncharacterized protein (TIGR02246 family)